jgi:hypothetical protein
MWTADSFTGGIKDAKSTLSRLMDKFLEMWVDIFLI